MRRLGLNSSGNPGGRRQAFREESHDVGCVVHWNRLNAKGRGGNVRHRSDSIPDVDQPHCGAFYGGRRVPVRRVAGECMCVCERGSRQGRVRRGRLLFVLHTFFLCFIIFVLLASDDRRRPSLHR